MKYGACGASPLKSGVRDTESHEVGRSHRSDSFISSSRPSNFWRIVVLYVLLVLMQLIATMDRGIVSTAVKEISNELHLSDLEAGSLNSAYLIGLLLCIPLCMYFSNKHKSRPFMTISIGVAVFTLAEIAASFCNSFATLFLCRIFSGAGDAVFNVIGVPWIDKHAPASVRAVWLALFTASFPLGIGVGTFLSGVLLETGKYNYTNLFQGEAMVMAPFCLFGFFVSSDRFLVSDRNPEAGNATNLADTSVAKEVVDTVKKVLTNPLPWLAVFGFAGLMFVSSGTGFWVVDYCETNLVNQTADTPQRKHEDSLCTLGMSLVVVFGSILGTIFGGVVLQLVGKTCYMAFVVGIAACMFSMISLVLTFALDTSILVFMCLFGGAIFFLMASVAVYIPGLMWLVPIEQRVIISALSAAAFNGLGAVPAPPLIGYIKDHLNHGSKSGVFPQSLMIGMALWMLWPVILWIVVAARVKSKNIGFSVDTEIRAQPELDYSYSADPIFSQSQDSPSSFSASSWLSPKSNAQGRADLPQ